MRVYTLALSISVHVAAVVAIIVAPLVATDVLPEPWRAVEYVHVVLPARIEPPPPPAPRETAPQSVRISADAAPVDEPSRIEPEPDTPPPTLLDAERSIIEGVTVDEFAAGNPLPPPPVERDPLRPGGSIRRPERIRYVAPIYPPIARAANVEGVVIIEAVLGADGQVREARVLRSIPLLDAAALEAVQQWQFTPTLLNGQAVPVVMTVTVVFSLR